MAEQMSKAQKQKVLQNLVKATQKKYGGDTHALSFVQDRKNELRYQFIPTPSENLNAALDGGFARGKIIEIAGENSSGKTSLALETIGLDHQNDPDSMWGWFDNEGDFDWDYAEIKGIDPERLVLWEMHDNGAETGLDTLEMLIRSNTLKGVVVNSVAGLTPKKELDEEMASQSIALQARMMSKLMRKITAICNKTKTTPIFINQMRTNVGQMFGDPSTTTGGKALRFFGTQRIMLRKVKLQKEDGITEDEGMRVNVSVLKNRAAKDNPYKKTSYTALYGEGIDKIRELAALAEELDLVVKSGAWIYYPTKENPEWKGIETRFQGKAQFLDFIRDNQAFQDHLLKEIREGRVIETLDDEEVDAIEKAEKQAAIEFDEEEGGE